MITVKGYGMISIGEKMVTSHRAAYELYIGKITDGLHVLHKCDNPSCVNPDHLFLGTNADNVRDRDNKGRGAKLKGELNGNSKLTVDDVIAIRSIYPKLSMPKLSKKYGVSIKLIWNIVNRQAWKHVV